MLLLLFKSTNVSDALDRLWESMDYYCCFIIDVSLQPAYQVFTDQCLYVSMFCRWFLPLVICAKRTSLNTIRYEYDTKEEFNMDSISKGECGQLNLAHVARKKMWKKEETKTNKQCPFNSVQVKIREVSLEGIRVTMAERICERDQF